MKMFKSKLEMIVLEEISIVYKERLKELKSNSKEDLRSEIQKLNNIIKQLEDTISYYKEMNRSKCSSLGMMDLQSYINLQQQLEKAKSP